MSLKHFLQLLLFFFLAESVSLSLFAMDDSIFDKDPKKETMPLLQDTQKKEEYIQIQIEKNPKKANENKKKFENTRKSLNRKIQKTSTHLQTALVYIEPEQVTKLPHSLVLEFEKIYFNEKQEPRQCVRCCHSGLLSVLEWAIGLAGSGSIAYSMTGFTNGVVGKLFNYPVGGALSNAVLGLSIALNADNAFIIFHDIGEFCLRKQAITFKPALKKELESCDFPRIFPKSKVHKFLEFLLIPSSALFTLGPISAWLTAEKYFPTFSLSMTPFIGLYFGSLYYSKGKEGLWTLMSKHSYSKPHIHQEARKSLVAGLHNLENALKKDDAKGLLTKKIWNILYGETNHFGDEKESLNNEKIISALSLLFAKNIMMELNDVTEKKDEQKQAFSGVHNWKLSTSSIEEKPFSERLANNLSKGLLWMNIAPSIIMESYAISTGLELIKVDQNTAQIIGHTLSTLFALRLFIEQPIHEQTINNVLHPCSSEEYSYKEFRKILGSKAFLHGAFNALIPLTLTYWSLTGTPEFLKIFLLCATGLRYLSLFTTLAAEKYNESVTKVAIRNKHNKTKISLNGKKAHLTQLIKKAKWLIKVKLTDETISELSRGLYGTL